MHVHVCFWGGIYLMLLMIPNLLWTKHPPKGYDPSIEPKALVLCERIGEVAVSAFAVISVNDGTEGSDLWLFLSILCMFLYELYWIRYFHNVSLHTFYGPLFHIPLPGATLPLLAFFFLALYHHAYGLFLADCLLAFAHLKIHLLHCRTHQISLFGNRVHSTKGEKRHRKMKKLPWKAGWKW